MNDISLQSSSSNPKLPRSAETILQMFQEAGIKDYEPQLLMQMTDLAHSLTKEVLTEAQTLSEFAGKKQIDRNDVEFTIKTFQEKHKPSRPPKLFLMELAAQKNVQPLQPLRQNFGLRLPNDRFCQVQPNFEYVIQPNGAASTAAVQNGDARSGGQRAAMRAAHGAPSANLSSEAVSSLLDQSGGGGGAALMNANNYQAPMEEDYD